jgi:hypothetical protein
MNHNQKKQALLKSKTLGNKKDEIIEKEYIRPDKILSKIPKEFLSEHYKIRREVLDKRGFDIHDYIRDVFI